jgi:hypothetical protein
LRIALATLSRMAVEDHHTDALFRARSKPLLEVHRSLERQAWPYRFITSRCYGEV